MWRQLHGEEDGGYWSRLGGLQMEIQKYKQEIQKYKQDCTIFNVVFVRFQIYLGKGENDMLDGE